MRFVRAALAIVIAVPGFLFLWALFILVIVPIAAGLRDGQELRHTIIYVAVILPSFVLAVWAWPRKLSNPQSKSN